MTNTWDVRTKYSESMSKLLVETRNYSDALPQKLIKMQEIYLQKDISLYSENEVALIKHYLHASIQKFYQANLSLEQLWSVSDSKRLAVLNAIDEGITQMECTEDEFIMISLAMETFLFQGRAFLDIYMIYLCLILRTGYQGKMSHDKFSKELRKVINEPFHTKSKYVSAYFDHEVFGKYDSTSVISNGWGTLLKELRDKIAHQDVIKPSYQSSEVLFGGAKFNWPTIQGITYDRFCQYMQNGMFMMLTTDISSSIYELEWQPGVYKSDMWAANS